MEIKNIMKSNIEIDFGARPYSENQVMFLSADTTKLKEDTGFTPKSSFFKGIREILNFRGASDK